MTEIHSIHIHFHYSISWYQNLDKNRKTAAIRLHVHDSPEFRRRFIMFYDLVTTAIGQKMARKAAPKVALKSAPNTVRAYWIACARPQPLALLHRVVGHLLPCDAAAAQLQEDHPEVGAAQVQGLGGWGGQFRVALNCYNISTETYSFMFDP